MKKQYLILILASVISFENIQAQGKADVKLRRLEAAGNHSDAAKMHLSKHAAGNRQSAISVAMNLFKSGRFSDALTYFKEADAISPLDDREQIFCYFESYKAVKDYASAESVIRTHMAGNASSDVFLINSVNVPYYEMLMAYRQSEIKTVASNSKDDDMAPVVFDNWLYFSSNRPEQSGTRKPKSSSSAFFGLFAWPLGGTAREVIRPAGDFGETPRVINSNGKQTSSIPLGLPGGFHYGPVSVSQDGNLMVITASNEVIHRQNPNPVGYNDYYSAKSKTEEFGIEVKRRNLRLLVSRKTGDRWSLPEELPFNSHEWTSQHGFFNASNSTLYFSSDRPGGQGGFDIWSSVFGSSGWSEPQNLGSKVNTSENEVFPAVSPDGKLFFSSNGWPGLGGLDLFLSAGDGSDPYNLLGGFNTESDDFGVTFQDGRIGFIVSNRPGGSGKDDIYSFIADFGSIMAANSIPVRLILGDPTASTTPISGKITLIEDGVSRDVVVNPSNPVITCKQSAAEIIISVPGYKKKVLSGKRNLVAEAKRIVLEPDPKPAEVVLAQQNTQSDSKATKNNKAVADAGSVISGTGSVALGSAKNLTGSAIKTDGGAKGSESTSANLFKATVYFDYNKHSLRNDAAEILAKVTYALMEEYPEADVVLTGHTDSRGTQENNFKLSERRAESVKVWLINKGIAARRIKMTYKGESELSVKCDKLTHLEGSSDRCLSEKEHQANRRVEIEILPR